MNAHGSMHRKHAITGLLITTLVSIVALGGFTGCTTMGGTPSQKTGDAATVTVKTTMAQRGAIQAKLSFTGDIKANSQVAVVPQQGARLDKLTVDVGSQVKVGDVIAEQDHSIQDAQLRQAQGNLAAATARLATLQDGPRAETVGQAQANLAAAQAKLAQIKAGPTQAQLDAAEAQVRLAQNQLYQAQVNGDAQGRVGFTQGQKDAATGVGLENIKIAEANLANLKAGATAETIAQAEAAVKAADEQLKLAQSPYTQHDIEAAQAQVSIAQAAVDLAQAQINQMIIKAPVDGVIADKLVSQGALVGPTTPLVNIISADVDIVVPIDQDQVQQVAVGQAVTCTVNNSLGNPISGAITSVAPAGDARSRSFSAKIKPNDPQHTLKPGMFVQVQIETSAKADALTVPQTAVVEKSGERYVFVASNGAAAMKKVTVGISDGTNVEITNGLDGNDPIIISGLNSLADGDKVVVAQ